MFSDCADFVLSQRTGQKVTGISPFYEKSSVTNGECFFECFNKAGCYTFSYNAISQHCALFTHCNAPCFFSGDSDVTTYERNCVAIANAGILNVELFTANVVRWRYIHIYNTYLK